MTPPVAVAEPAVTDLPEMGLESSNGASDLASRTNGHPRIEVLTASTPAQAAAVMAAVEHFLSETATPANGHLNGHANGNGNGVCAWRRAALNEAAGHQMHLNGAGWR